MKWTLAVDPVTSTDSAVIFVVKSEYQKPFDLNPAFDRATTGKSRARLARYAVVVCASVRRGAGGTSRTVPFRSSTAVWMMAVSSEDDGLGSDEVGPGVGCGPADSWHPERANPSSTAIAAPVRGRFILGPLADVPTAYRRFANSMRM
ncbi:hypothetical protein [Arthrobacter sp. KNU40]|uniref:hypothetical protein n=1 Tax=Arthrobacter sp. KNU40 TaxID=3447965 RepID=UPI003F63F635